MDEHEINKRNKAIEQWADTIRAVIQEAKNAGMVLDVLAGSRYAVGGRFSITVGDGAYETDNFHVWSDDDQRPVNS